MVNSNQKTVGVLIPCFNQGQFVAQCVQSLKGQTYAHWKAVLVDDASNDGQSPELCQKAASDQVKVVLLEKNLGRALVRNECLKHLGDVDFVLILDCDDFISETYIDQLVSALDSSLTAGLAYGTLHYFGESGYEPDNTIFPDRTWSRELMYLENLIPGSGVLFRYECLSELKGWRQDFTIHSGEDHDIWLQAVEAGWEPVWVDDAVYFYRRHAASYMANRDPDMALYLDVRLLRHHFREIKSSVGVEKFLNHRLMPDMYRSLRTMDFRRVLKFLTPLMQTCPQLVVTLFARYYLKRLRLRVPGNRHLIR